MPHTCQCTITCATHGAGPQLMQLAKRAARIVTAARAVEDLAKDIVAPLETPTITIEEAIEVLRSIEASLDQVGELTVATIQEFRRLMAKLDGIPERRIVERPF